MENLTIVSTILGIVAFIGGFLWWLYKENNSVKDILDKAKKYYRNFISYIDLPRRLLARRMNSEDFMTWQDKVLMQIYGKERFTKLLNTYYPVCSIEFDHDYGFHDVNSLCYDENNQPLLREKDKRRFGLPDIYGTEIMTCGVETDPEALKNELELKRKLMGTDNGWSGYNWFTARSMNDGNHIGYILDHAEFDRNGKIHKLHLAVGNYKLNLLTSHILTYELYMAYCELKKAGKEDKIDLETLWPMIPFRRYIHHATGCFSEDGNAGNALFSGLGRYSLLSVQCMVMMCTTDEDSGQLKYYTFFGKRSKSTHKVSTKLGCYQFPPSGGFDLYDDMSSMCIIKDSCKLNMALMREYLEEIFNIKEYAKSDGANEDPALGINKVDNDPCVKSIKKMLKADLNDKRFKDNAKKAYFTTVGANVDLIDLRLSVNCLLVINDYNYYTYMSENDNNNSDGDVYRKKFLYNEEIDMEESRAEQLKTLSSLESVEEILLVNPNESDPEKIRGKRNIVEDSVSLYIQGKKAFDKYIESVRREGVNNITIC